MASTSKTQNYSLNQWSGTDKPQRVDFNADNNIIDEALHNHVVDMNLHISPEDRHQNEAVVYLGDDAASQTIQFEYAPNAVIVIPISKGIVTNKNSIIRSYASAAVSGMNGNGISISGKTVTVEQQAPYTGATNISCLNELGIVYLVVAFRSFNAESGES